LMVQSHKKRKIRYICGASDWLFPRNWSFFSRVTHDIRIFRILWLFRLEWILSSLFSFELCNTIPFARKIAHITDFWSI